MSLQLLVYLHITIFGAINIAGNTLTTYGSFVYLMKIRCKLQHTTLGEYVNGQAETGFAMQDFTKADVRASNPYAA